MDTIVKVIVWIVAAVFAYSVVAAERRGRKWSPTAAIAAYLALFGGTTFGLLTIESYYSPKLTDSYPSDTDLLIGGLVILAAVVVLALDLLGKVDVMGQIQRAVSGGSSSSSSSAGTPPPTGDDD